MINGNLSYDERRYQISRFYAIPLDYIPQIAVIGVMLIAVSVLLGRYQGILMLPAFLPGLTAMDTHVAIGLLFCGTSLWLLQPKEITPLRRRAGQTMALFCLLPAFLSVADTQLIPASGLDWLLPLFTLDSNVTGDSPHRHIAFTMAGLALFLLGFNRTGLLSIIQWLAVLTLTMLIVIMFSYLYSLTGYYSYTTINGMALSTALSLTFLTNGILFARPHEGIMRLITSAAAGGVIMRRLLPIVVVAPLMIGWLMLAGQRFGLVTPYFGLAMHEVMTTLLITVFIIHIAISLNREEKLRHCAEAGAKKHQSDLAHLVRITTMGEMVTSIAHELKQPLTAISLYSANCKEMLSATHAPVDQLTRQLDEIQIQSLRAAEIIHSTLEFARKKELHAASVQLNELITEIKNFLEAEARNGDVQLVLELAPKLPTIEGDAIQLRQVLLNIIHNAIESMQAKVNKPKLVTVQTSLTAAGEIRTIIADNGPGMDAKTLSHIFESFFTTKGDAGIGMGLSISRSIIEAHGGLLWATSIPGQGSTFTFTLPREGLKDQGRG